MKLLSKLFLSVILSAPGLAFSAEFEEAPFEKATAQDDRLNAFQQSCLIFLIDGARHCAHDDMKRAYQKMSAFYNRCVIQKTYTFTFDSHKETRAIANRCWLNKSSRREHSLIHSLIIHYFPDDLN